MIDDEFNFEAAAEPAATVPAPAVTPAPAAVAAPVTAAEPEAPQPQFEELLGRLEAVVAEMESGRLSLEDCLARFEEGAKLATQCSKRLEETEKKVELLMRRGDQMQAQAFPGTEAR
jgi:exodeoxyribonuclease VII small subunit